MLTAFVYGQTENLRPVSLNEFVRANTDVGALTNGRAFYVKTPGDPMAEIELRYDYPELQGGTAYEINGQPVEIEGRYNRDERRIEVMYDRNLRALEGSLFPTVVIGKHTYVYILLPGDLNKEGNVYAEQSVRSPNGTYGTVKTFKVKPSSNVPPDRGFVTPEPSPARLDSTMYVVGLKQFAVELPRRRNRLVGDLEPCEVDALRATRGYSPNDEVYVETLLTRMEADCSGDDD